MSGIHVPGSQLPVRMPLKAPTTRRARITPKLQIALRDIIENGHELDEAARVAGLSTFAVRQALYKPHVIAWLKAETEVFRASLTAQNLFHAKRIRDNNDNMPAVNAIKFIHDYGRDQTSDLAANHSAHVTIQIVNAGAGDVLNQKVVDVPAADAVTIPNFAAGDAGGEK